jgi:hypothetical protein
VGDSRKPQTFEVVAAFEALGRGYVIARLLDPSASFEVADDATLGGVAVERWLEMPRIFDEARRPRFDVFGFCLRRREDLARFNTGDRVDLR